MIVIGINTCEHPELKESLLAEATFNVSTIFRDGQLHAVELEVRGVEGRYWDRYSIKLSKEEIAVMQGVVWAIEKRP